MSTISILPESAPFNAEQRAWLNGFFAGMLGLQAGDGAQLAAVQQVALGNMPSEGSPVALDEPEETFPWHDPALPITERITLAEGKPLPRKLMAAMAQLNCGACGYLCQTYSEAIASGSETNLKLCSPGGSETAKMIKLLLKEQPANGTANGHANGHAVNGQASKAWSRSNPFPAKVISSTNINGEGSEKHTSHVVIDLTGSGLKYEVGDALGVFPRNCPELVDEILAAVRADASTLVTYKGESKPLRELLLTSDLRNVDERHVAWLQTAGNAEHIEPLRTLAEDEDQLAAIDLLDLLLRFPVAVDLNGLSALMSPLAPRLYSIASSQNANPNEVHLTVGKATRLVGSRVRKGVASTMFSDRTSAGEEVRVFVQPTHGFKLPADKSTPIIMVGPGTGIAPFRAFVQDRQVQQATGESWLFFGDQRSGTDFLYAEEWDGHLKAGSLTRLDTAFSRDQEEKIYVQTRMREHGAELFRWLERGAYFYVCGDAKRMAVDVDRALHDVVAEHGNKSADEAKAYVAELSKSKRYLRDVY